MKKYGSIDLMKQLYNTLYSLDALYGDVDIVEFKVSIDLVGHINVTYEKHFVVISPVEYDGSTDYIIDDLTDNEHSEYCGALNDICICVSNIVKSWFA